MGKPRSRTAPSGRVTPRRAAPAAPTPDEMDAASGVRTRPGFGRRVLNTATRHQHSRDELINSENWQTPTIVDILLGVVLFAIGVTLSIMWSPIGGGGIGAVGLLYVMLAIRRWRQWSTLRRDGVPDTD